MARSEDGRDLFQASMSRARDAIGALNTAQRILIGYVAISLLGAAALILIEGARDEAGLVDHAFTAVSAVSTTGLLTVPLSSTYSLASQICILALIQVGGLGYMTLAAVFVSRFDRRLRKRQEEETKTDFALPPEADIRSFAKAAIALTLAAEAIGALVLYIGFERAGVAAPFYQAIFHAVSAFCTSGLSLFTDSFAGFAGDPLVLLPICAISTIGAVGFLLAWDAWRSIKEKSWRMTHTNRVVLGIFLPSLALTGVLLFFSDPRLTGLPFDERWLAALFSAMTSSTTVGFSVLPAAELTGAAFVLILATMVMGASPSGTSGGIKTTTVAILVATMVSSLRQQGKVRLFGHTISLEKIRASATTLIFYLALMMAATFALALIEPSLALGAVFFEVVSALGTIGLSQGITADLAPAGKAVLIVLMIAGRVGILAFGAALFSDSEDEEQIEQAERV